MRVIVYFCVCDGVFVCVCVYLCACVCLCTYVCVCVLLVLSLITFNDQTPQVGEDPQVHDRQIVP